jgi:hypothetical protein
MRGGLLDLIAESSTLDSRETMAEERSGIESSGKAIVVQGDAFDLLAKIPGESIDLIITSPPYWGHREYGLGHNWELFNEIPKVRKIGNASPGYDWYRRNGGVLGLEPYPEWYISHLAEILDRAEACLKSTGSMWINLGDTFFARWSSVRDSGRQGLGRAARYRRKTPLGDFRQEKQLLLLPSRFAIEMQDRGWILAGGHGLVDFFNPNEGATGPSHLGTGEGSHPPLVRQTAGGPPLTHPNPRVGGHEPWSVASYSTKLPHPRTCSLANGPHLRAAPQSPPAPENWSSSSRSM